MLTKSQTHTGLAVNLIPIGRTLKTECRTRTAANINPKHKQSRKLLTFSTAWLTLNLTRLPSGTQNSATSAAAGSEHLISLIILVFLDIGFLDY